MTSYGIIGTGIIGDHAVDHIRPAGATCLRIDARRRRIKC